MIEEPVIDIEKIQGNVIPGFRLPYQCIIACKLRADSDFNTFLISIIPKITRMSEVLKYQNERISFAKRTKIFGKKSFLLPDTKNLFWLNIGIGRQLALQFENDISHLDNSFNLGLAARSFLLGDPKNTEQEGNRNNWIFGSLNKEADVILIAASDDPRILEQEVEKLQIDISKLGITVLYLENGERLDDDTEHFGFKDGISQPEIRGVIDNNSTYLSPRTIRESPDNRDSVRYSAPGKLLIWTGQFVFGYPKQSPSSFENPVEASELEKSPFIRNGSFLVFRRLKQDVKTFYEEANSLFEKLSSVEGFKDITFSEFLEKLVGRTKTGFSLLFKEQTSSEEYLNNFNYKDDTNTLQLNDGSTIPSVKADPTGLLCPKFAHIRKVNPRDVSTDQGAETNTATFRILRRGIPFGSPYNFKDLSDAANLRERGLLFLSYQTSIQNQFELLVNKWANQENRPESPDGYDMIIGQNNDEDSQAIRSCIFHSKNGDIKKLETQRVFVTPTAGGYFFCPSTDALTIMLKT